jgi:hypothetical protein
MKSMIIIAALALSASAFAAKSYQVTGTVLEVTESTITVDKKGEKFEIARPAGMGGDVQKGAKVTVQYSMTATSIDIKSEATAPKKDKKAKK